MRDFTVGTADPDDFSVPQHRADIPRDCRADVTGAENQHRAVFDRLIRFFELPELLLHVPHINGNIPAEAERQPDSMLRNQIAVIAVPVADDSIRREIWAVNKPIHAGNVQNHQLQVFAVLQIFFCNIAADDFRVFKHLVIFFFCPLMFIGENHILVFCDFPGSLSEFLTVGFIILAAKQNIHGIRSFQRGREWRARWSARIGENTSIATVSSSRMTSPCSSFGAKHKASPAWNS